MTTQKITRLPRVPSLSWDDCRLLVDSIVDYAIFMLDTEGRVATWNAGAQRIKGYRADEIVGEHFSRFYTEDDVRDGKPQRFLEIATKEGHVDDVGWRIRKDGSRFWASVVLTAVRDEAQNLRGFGKVTRDLTVQREAEERERQLLREQTARELAEATARQTRYLSEATAALGSSLISEKMLEALAGTLVPGLGEWCIIYLLEADKLKDVAFSHADSAKRAQASLYRGRFASDRARTDGLWKVVRGGTTEILEDDTGELQPRSTTDDAPARSTNLSVKAVTLVPIKVRDRMLGVIALGSGDEGRTYDLQDRELVEEIGRRAGAAVENVQLYAAARDAVREAERASQAKDQFLAVVSHELRTPLSAILGWSELLKGRVTDATLAKPVDVIYRNAVAQVKIIDDILDVSRVITGKFRLEPKPTDLVAIAKEATEVVRPSAVAKRIEIRFTALPEFCLLVADPERLQQVIWNLLSNAVKFTDTGGHIEIAVQQDRSSVLLSVTDTGKGLDPEFLPYVFDRFRQADSSTTRRVGGLGLGLALVRHIVELHGGQVAAQSEGVGKGATFSIALPIRAVLPTAPTSPAEGSGAGAAPRPPASLDDVRVLVVDDEADARDLVTTVLREAGATVETAASAAEAYAAFKRFQPGVLVSDVGMPGEDGLSLMRRIRELSASDGGRVPSLALTAFAREEDRSRAIGSGYTTHLGKPVNSSVLVSAVANLAAVGRSV